MAAVATFGAPAVAGHRLEAIGYASIAGFAEDDLRTAFETFRTSCAAMASGAPELRRGKPASAALQDICRAALDADVSTISAARAFFETHFQPWRIHPMDADGREQRGFLTGYYEPVVAASKKRTPDFTTPILSRPPDLVTLDPGEDMGALSGLAAARRRPDGGLEPYADRAAIETGAIDDRTEAIAWVRDPIERFIIQVQGSARLRWPDGSEARLTYSGRNGLPYTSIGRALVEEGKMTAERMSLAALKQWVRDHGQDEGAEGLALMRRNRSFVFFALGLVDGAGKGPIGAAGVPLAPLRSIAVDRSLWSYGLPFWISADLPWRGAEKSAFQRLMIAQDTGSAILGPARADLFFGSGDEAGARAGDIRHPGEMIVLLPRHQSAP